LGWLNLLAIALALAADAFAVAIVAGATLAALTRRHVFRLAFHFGLFQALMPLLGWGAGRAVHGLIAAVDHWLAFALLAGVGGHMVWVALRPAPAVTLPADPTRGWRLVVLAVATSIDAFAVGLSLAMLGVPIAVPVVVIGLVAAAVTVTGMLIGRRIGAHWGPRAELAGGVVLIAIGVRILAAHWGGGG
jgi:manganese efflux pump family protein